ncbi:MAG: PEP-CTERM sorting domain-containing protein [Burkholderiaceae bacterium]|nr:PEP-CTERM sorting domain-containing protein [Burkholderiaceae bacterium]
MKHTLNLSLAAALGLGCIGTAGAAVKTDDSAELFLVIWDQTNKVAYNKDLGIDARAFWVQAQQDAGYSKFIDLDAGTDPVFAAFKNASPDSSKQIWAVFGADVNGGASVPNEHYLYTTVKQGSAAGVINPDWQSLTGLSNDEDALGGGGLASSVAIYIATSNLQDLGALNTHGVAGVDNGAGFTSNADATSKPGYIGNGNFKFYGSKGVPGSAGEFLVQYRPFNAVGKSSWFYMGTVSTEDNNDPFAVDEFDNLGADGYWGLGVDGTGKYVLSFNMPAYTPAATVSSAEGRLRLSTTDYASGFASRQIAVPADEFAVQGLSPVPEPATGVLFGLGLLALGLAASRRSVD